MRSQGAVIARYQAVRDQTERIASPLCPEDQVVQSMPDVSPTKWHRAHTTWFFETFLLVPHMPGYEVVDPTYGYLFNSYYEGVGARHRRDQRGLITRPDVHAVGDYRRRVDDAMHGFLDEVAPERPELAALAELGIQHEQQHQELVLMDIKHVLSCHPDRPAYAPTLGTATATETGTTAGRVREPSPTEPHPGGITEVGAEPGDGFHFDNEAPRHQALLHPHAIAARPVTCGDWLDFMEAGGYQDAGLWLSDGWAAVESHGWDAPEYWRAGTDGWAVYTLRGERAVDGNEPVVHVSYYEADAFARWAGQRLPTEFEWETAAAGLAPAGNLLGELAAAPLHPRSCGDGADNAGPEQMFGDVWEWTSSAYSPYPGFRPAPGAVGEYNGKFMIDQQVLRGGAAVTPAGHVRATYRNFFPARARWMFAGLRLAGDMP